MDASSYQVGAMKTAIYPGRGSVDGLLYVTLGLAGEAGEIANKVKKLLRDSGGEMTSATHEALFEELGDVMWYAAMLADELDEMLSDIMEHNLDKLNQRAHRGTLQGSGDAR